MGYTLNSTGVARVFCLSGEEMGKKQLFLNVEEWAESLPSTLKAVRPK